MIKWRGRGFFQCQTQFGMVLLSRHRYEKGKWVVTSIGGDKQKRIDLFVVFPAKTVREAKEQSSKIILEMLQTFLKELGYEAATIGIPV
jgi:hypothetical protein